MKTSKSKEIIIIGAGHNSLVAACLLAKRGKKVTVYEQNEQIGGLGRGYEFAPGYRSQGFFNDTSMVRSGVADSVELSRFGIKFASEKANFKVPQTSGGFIETPADVNQRPTEAWGWSAKDLKGYEDYRGFFDRTKNFMSKVFDDTPPNLNALGFGSIFDIGMKAITLRLLGRKDMMEVLRRAPMCVADYLNEYFENDAIKASLALPAVQFNYAGPWSPQTSLGLMIHETFRSNSVVGGSAGFVEALGKAAASFGVTIKTSAKVTGLEIDDDQVRGVHLGDGKVVTADCVLSGADPKSTMLKLIPRGVLQAKTRHKLEKYRTKGSTAKLDFAVSSLPDLDGDSSWARLRMPSSLDDLERTFDPIKYGEIGERLSLDVHVPSRENSTLAPSGHHVVSIVAHHVPNESKNGWESDRSKLESVVLAQLDEVLPGFKSNVVASSTMTPLDIEKNYGTVGGHPLHGEQLIDQILNRPTLDTAGYRTPIRGLHMIGSGTHPGGGMTGAPGALAVKELF